MSDESTDVERMISLLRHTLGDDKVDFPSKVQPAFNAIMASRPDLLVMVDNDGAICFVSNACEDFFGLPSDELVGRFFETLVAPQDLAAFGEFMDQRVGPLTGQSFSKLGPLDLRVVQKDPKTDRSSLRWVAMRVSSSDLPRGDGSDESLLFFKLNGHQSSRGRRKSNPAAAKF